MISEGKGLGLRLEILGKVYKKENLQTIIGFERKMANSFKHPNGVRTRTDYVSSSPFTDQKEPSCSPASAVSVRFTLAIPSIRKKYISC
jgi:hypothetical protein